MPSVLDELIIKVGATADFSKVERKIKGVEQKLERLGDVATKVGAGLTAAAGGTLFAFAEYEKGFAEMAAKTGKSMASLEKSYGSAVKSIARQTGVSISQVQAGFQKGLSAGLEGKAVIDAVTQATKSQAAGIGSLEDTISSATTAWSVLGVDASKAMDIITAAAQVGEGETEHFGQSLKGLVGQGGTLGIEFEELAGALAAVSQSAKTVTVGETQMIAFLKAISAPAKGAEKALEALSEATGQSITFGGLRSTIETQGMAAGFAHLKDVISDLKAAGADVAPIISDLFPSIEAQQFFNTVDPAKIAELTGAIAGSEDTIQTAFEEGETTVSRQMARTKESLKGVAAAIGETLVPALTNMTEWLEKAVGWFEKQDPWLKELVGHALAAGPALLAVGVGLKTMQGVLGPLASLLKAHPLILLLAAAAAAVIYWDEIVALFEKAYNWLKDIFEEPATATFEWVSNLWNTAIDTVKGTWQGLLDTITSGPADIFAWIQNAWRRVVDSMVEFLPSTLRDWLGLETLSDAREALKELREEALDDFEDAKDEIADFNEDFGELGVKLKLNPASASDLIRDIDTQMQAVRDRLPSSDAKKGPLSDLTASGKALVDTFAEGMRKATGLDPAAFDSEVLVPTVYDVLQTRGPQHDFAWVMRQVGYDLEDQGFEIPANLAHAVRDIMGRIHDPAVFDSEVLRPIIDSVLEARGPQHDLAWVVRQVGYDLEDEDYAIPHNLADIVRKEVDFQQLPLAPNLPLGPVPPSALPAPASAPITITVGEIRIDAPGADAQEIASRLGDALAEEMRALAEEVDGNALA